MKLTKVDAKTKVKAIKAVKDLIPGLNLVEVRSKREDEYIIHKHHLHIDLELSISVTRRVKICTVEGGGGPTLQLYCTCVTDSSTLPIFFLENNNVYIRLRNLLKSCPRC